MTKQQFNELAEEKVKNLNHGNEDCVMSWKSGFLYACKLVSDAIDNCEDMCDFNHKMDELAENQYNLDEFE